MPHTTWSPPPSALCLVVLLVGTGRLSRESARHGVHGVLPLSIASMVGPRTIPGDRLQPRNVFIWTRGPLGSVVLRIRGVGQRVPTTQRARRLIHRPPSHPHPTDLSPLPTGRRHVCRRPVVHRPPVSCVCRLSVRPRLSVPVALATDDVPTTCYGAVRTCHKSVRIHARLTTQLTVQNLADWRLAWPTTPHRGARGQGGGWFLIGTRARQGTSVVSAPYEGWHRGACCASFASVSRGSGRSRSLPGVPDRRTLRFSGSRVV